MEMKVMESDRLSVNRKLENVVLGTGLEGKTVY